MITRHHPRRRTSPKAVRPKVINKVQHAISQRAPQVHRGLEHVASHPLGEGLQSKLERSPLAQTPAFKRLLAQLEQRFASGGVQDDYLDELREKAKEKARQYGRLIALGRDIIARFRNPELRRRYLQEVLNPARNGRIDGRSAWDRMSGIVGMDVLRTTEDHAGPGWTIGIGLVGEVGYAVGFEGCVGLAGKRHACPIFYRTVTVGVGAYVDAGLSIEVEFAPCTPLDFGGLSVGIDLGGSYGLGGGLGVGFEPHLLAPRLRDQFVFDALTVSMTGGISVEASLWIEGAIVRQLPGILA